MEHDFIDKYSDLDSVIHRLDPRIKIVSALLFIIFVVFTPPDAWVTFPLYFLLILFVVYLSRVPYGYVFKRSLVPLPFVLLIVVFVPFLKQGRITYAFDFGLFKISLTYAGLMVVWNVFAKSYLSALVLICLSSTTKFSDLLKGLEKLKAPRIFVLIASFMYRYIFVLADEVMRMKQAYRSRSFKKGRARQAKAFGAIAGALFVRSYERAERVYLAMCSRGFDGEVKTLYNFKPSLLDFCCLALFTSYLLLVRLGAAKW